MRLMNGGSFGDVKVKTLVWWGTIFGMISSAVGVSAIAIYRYRKKMILREKVRKKRENANRKVNIGAIFGMDVGGTLTKIVYFEKNSAYNRGESLQGNNCDDVESTRAPGSVEFDFKDSSSSSSSSGNGHAIRAGNDSNSSHSISSGIKKSKSLSQLDGEEHKAAAFQFGVAATNKRPAIVMEKTSDKKGYLKA